MYPFFFVIFHNFYWFLKVSFQKAHIVNNIITQTWPQLCYKKACCTEAAFSLNRWRWQSLSLSLLCTQQLDVEEAFSWRDAANSKQFLGISKLQDIPYLLQKMSFPLWCVSTCLAVETVLDSRGLLICHSVLRFCILLRSHRVGGFDQKVLPNFGLFTTDFFPIHVME